MPPCGGDSNGALRVKRAERKTRQKVAFIPPAAIPGTLCSPIHNLVGGAFMAETESQFKGIRGFLRLAIGVLLLAVALGSAVYLLARLLDYL